jgi:predicted dehydrogenase
MNLSLAIIGASGHTNLVLPDLANAAQVRFCAYAPSFSGEDVTAYASCGARRYEEWQQMLDAERPQVVVACGRYDLNGLLAAAALERGCHVISEKPAGQSLAQVARLRELVAASGLVYGIMLNMRYEAPFYTARQLVQRGLIGEPYLISAQKSYRWGRRPVWYGEREHYGNTMTWIGIHAFDLARWIGGVGFGAVWARQGNLVHAERPACQDVATVLVALENGGSAVFNLDYLRPEAAPTHGDDRLRIAGERGVLEICDLGRRLQVTTADQHVAAWPLQEAGRTVFADFLAAVEGRGPMLISAEEAFSVTEFAIRVGVAAEASAS